MVSEMADLASAPSAPSACSSSRARTMVSAGGGASQSKAIMLSTPSAFSCSTVLASSERCISGTCSHGSHPGKSTQSFSTWRISNLCILLNICTEASQGLHCFYTHHSIYFC